MVLVDTSVWVAHLRHGAIGLEALLHDGRVVWNPCIAGELACVNLQRGADKTRVSPNTVHLRCIGLVWQPPIKGE